MTDYKMLTCAGETTRTDDRYFMVANTGAPMRLMFYDTPVVIDLAGAEFAGETLPVIYRHDSDVLLGATTSRRILGIGETQAVKEKQVTGAAIIAEWQFTNTQETARGIKENLDNGFPFQVSIGAQPLEMERVAKNETAIVNGKEYKGALLIARKSLIKELSVVVFGADRFTSTIKAQENGGITMSNIDNPVPEIPKIEGAEPTQVVKPPTVPDMNAMQEQMRVLSIETIANTIAAAGTVGEIELEGGVIFRSIEAAEGYAKKNPSVSADAFKKAMLDASRKRPVGPVAPGTHIQSHDVTNAVMECAILKSVARDAGIPLVATTAKDGTRYGLEAWFDGKTLEASDAPALRNPSLGTIYATQMRQVFGYNEFANPRSDDFWERAGQAYSQARFAGYGIQAAGGSPISLDVVWLNVARKILLATSQGIPTTYQQWCKIINVQDFKPTKMASISSPSIIRFKSFSSIHCER